MKRVFLCGAVCLDGSAEPGVVQKFISQAQAFTELGVSVDCVGYDGDSVVVSRYDQGEFVDKHVIANVGNARFKRYSLWKGISKYIQDNSYDLAFIRYPFTDRVFLNALRAMRKTCANVVIEIPSYPLQTKNATAMRKVLFTMDGMLHNKCAKYVDRIVYIGNKTDRIFNCPAYQIPNGLPDKVRNTASTGYHFDGNSIDLICVSNMSPFHGYDRLLYGLAEYYKCDHQYDVNVVMVGDGVCRTEYEDIVKNNDMSDHVRFTGMLKGEALTAEYQKATVGIGSLGLFREGFEEASSLKTKEYLIRGLPFVYAVNEIGLESDFPYALRLPNDETRVRIEDIVDFVLTYKEESSDSIAEKMKAYAEENFNWKKILQDSCGDLLA